jgi:flagellar basal-body rod protein FlgB
MSLLDPTQSILEAAMQGAEARQTVLTQNLANADTPGYQRQDVNFESALQSAVASGQPLNDLSFTSSTDNDASNPDGNGVDANQESAYIAQNGLQYEALTQLATTRDSILQAAMGVSA